MKLETFSYLPPMTEEQVARQVRYIVDSGLIPVIEYTDFPDAEDVYWTMWGLPLIGVEDANKVMEEINACRAAHPDCYLKVTGYEPVKQYAFASFVAYRPD